MTVTQGVSRREEPDVMTDTTRSVSATDDAPTSFSPGKDDIATVTGVVGQRSRCNVMGHGQTKAISSVTSHAKVKLNIRGH